MDIKQLEEANEAIEILKALDLPISIEQLGKRKILETEYLKENAIPKIQTYIQSLVERLYKPFCLVVEYEHGAPVQVRIAEIKKIRQDVLNKSTPRVRIIRNVYTSASIQSEWLKYLDTIPDGKAFYKIAITQSYSSLSKLLRTMQSLDMMKYTSPLFKVLNLPTTGKLTPTAFVQMLEPEQFVQETTREGTKKRIVLWSQTQKTQTKDGKRIKVFEKDGVTPVLVDKTKPIKEGQWSLKTLCDLMAQKEHFANLRLGKITKT